ncbi:MAG: ATP-dependent DNA helicase UvrD2 [Acidimicrobiales bacterium]|nr:ATP-dependent DNA helicase UvrD2 [Acidimicrobiales bacterium]
MAVRCASCGGEHDSVAEVRRCHAGAPPGPRRGGGEPDPEPPGEWDDAGWDDAGWDDADEGYVDGEPSWPSGGGEPPRPGPRPTAREVVARAGPEALGRGLVVGAGASPGGPWSGAERVVIDEAVLTSPAEVLATVEAAWVGRRRLVVELRVPFEAPPDEVDRRPPFAVPPSFAFPLERLHHLVWSNAVDGREPGRDRWRWAELAVASGATPGGEADVLLPDGTPAWCDGGPFLVAGPGLAEAGAVVLPRVSVERGSLRPPGPGAPDGLAPDQLEAALHPGGPARIIAPAGSGKTRVLAERARQLVLRWNVPPAAVALVAYNVRAREEMQQRTTDLAGLQIRTLNSLALAVLNGTGPFRRRGAAVRTVDEREVRAILDRLVELPKRLNTDPAAAWLDALTGVRLGLRSPEEVEGAFQGDVDGLVAVFPRFREALAAQGAVDYDEQIYRAIEVLLTEPATRRSAQQACRLLLVDEFQDLTPAHLLLLRLLSSPELAVFGVGDDDQTIYGYSGASPRWLIDYPALFAGAGTHALEVNYRCPPAVVGAAATLLGHNRQRLEKVIRPAPGRMSEPAALRVEVASDPVATTLDEVQRLVDGGAEPVAVAVLARVRASLAPVQVGLGFHGVPCTAAVGAGYLQRTGVAAALAWLRVAAAPAALAGADIAASARRPPRKLSPRVVEWLAEQRTVASIRRLAARLGERDRGKIDAYADDVERLAGLVTGGARTADVLTLVRDELGLGDSIAALDGSRRGLDASHVDDVDALIALGRLHPEPSTFGRWLREQLERPAAPGGVQLATIHAVKGREWPHVVVHHVTEGLVPHRLADDVEEERRVFHVALTRCALDVVVVTGTPPSPFVAELSSPWVPGATGPVAARPRREPSAPPRRGGPQEPADGAAAAARDALRAWRLERSRADGVPAYVVFDNATLDALVERQPSTLAQLAQVRGIGPAKLERYGDEILAVLDQARA